jgi:hypothetical protein
MKMYDLPLEVGISIFVDLQKNKPDIFLEEIASDNIHS